jgi:hypothetical protein
MIGASIVLAVAAILSLIFFPAGLIAVGSLAFALIAFAGLGADE